MLMQIWKNIRLRGYQADLIFFSYCACRKLPQIWHRLVFLSKRHSRKEELGPHIRNIQTVSLLKIYAWFCTISFKSLCIEQLVEAFPSQFLIGWISRTEQVWIDFQERKNVAHGCQKSISLYIKKKKEILINILSFEIVKPRGSCADPLVGRLGSSVD